MVLVRVDQLIFFRVQEHTLVSNCIAKDMPGLEFT
jgi:hypothetical protein